ncbi:MAG: magnesium/cobalt transporter CorA [Candidatus Hermodarchaeota archaeon]|nr:magnesium/cobalt transporter CorA [Candidatus Hermodarchaeota archaeon]
MSRLFQKKSKKSGLPPGTPAYVGEKKPTETRITIIEYDKENLHEKEVKTIEECLEAKESSLVTWIRITGLKQIPLLEHLGKEFKIHPLVIEDILNTTQRPKIEDYKAYLFIVVKNVDFTSKEIESNQVSIILGPNFVISIQENQETILQPIIDRIRNNRGIIRQMKNDFLAYAILDAVLDNYFTAIEKLSDKIEVVEDELISNPVQDTLHEIYHLKQNLIVLRKSIWPFREVVSRMERGRYTLIDEKLLIYIRDIYDHSIQVMETVETYRDMLSGMLDIYLSSVSNRMNEVMKVLTIIATIFIPLTLIVGIYGMNFRFMPELEIPIAYPLVWLSMIIVGSVLVVFFKRKRWI